MFNIPSVGQGPFNAFDSARAAAPAARPSEAISLDSPLPFDDTFGNPPFDIADGQPAIQLQGRDYERFKYRFNLALAVGRTRMATIHRDAEEDRATYRMLDRKPEYEGAPAITTPISANKADGELAHILDAIEQRPLFSVTPEGFGEPAEDASEVAPIVEAALEREINRGGSRELITRGLARDAVQVGTGIAKLVMVQHPSGEWFAVPTDVYRLENAYFDRIYVPNLKNVTCAFEIRKPYYVLDEWAQQGIIDSAQLEKVRGLKSARFKETIEEEEFNFDETSYAFQEENAVYRLYEGYMRFRPQGGNRSRLYQIIWSDIYKEPLSLRINPVEEAFDHPPIALVRVGKQPGFLLGRSSIRRLNPVQQIADNAINNHLAVNNLAANPPFLYRKASPFGKALIDHRIYPGQGIPVTGASNSQDDVKLLQFPNPGYNLQDIEVANSFADKATFTEESIGSSGATRKTYGQFRIESNKGVMRQRLDLGDIAYDMATLGTMVWAMAVAFKLKSEGVIEVGDNGKFLGYRPTNPEDVQRMQEQVLYSYFGPDVDPQGEQAVQDFMQEFERKLTDNGIPSARRADLTISLKGTKVIADQAAEAEAEGQWLPVITSLIQAVQQNKYINYNVRRLGESLGFKDIDKRMPALTQNIQEQEQSPEATQQMLAPYHDLVARSSNMA